jgi:hypothetical protein
MSTDLTRKSQSIRRGFARRNSMAFPSKLRDAIPAVHDGRILELDSINAHVSNIPFFGPLVELKLIVKETGKLSDSFVVVMRLEPDAARKLSTTLADLAEKAEEQDGQ